LGRITNRHNNGQSWVCECHICTRP
jgi:hypothetical protein